jgi:NADH-quinone oxidoreductase subunit J
VELLVFSFVAAAALVTALTVLLHRNPVIGALFLVSNLVCVAVLYLLLQAQFLAAIQVIVYAGAIMVLILFVIMLLNLRQEAVGIRAGGAQKTLGALAAIGFVLMVAKGLVAFGAGLGPVPMSYGTVEYVGRHLFGEFFYPFELLSLILLVAMAGAVVLAKKKL